MNIQHIDDKSTVRITQPQEKLTKGDQISVSEREHHKMEWKIFFQQAVIQSQKKMQKINEMKTVKRDTKLCNLMTRGAVMCVVTAGKQEFNYRPICQIIHIKEIPTNPGVPSGFRIVISDGECYVMGMIVPRLNSLIENHELKKHSIVCINKFYIQLVNGKNLMVVLGIDVLNNSVKEKVGNHVIREVTYN